jgi:hypothetical protein
MIDQNRNDGIGGWQQGREVVERDAAGREEVALRLTLEAIRESQRAIIGVLALPASMALSVAAGISYATAFLERGVQMFEMSLARVARDARLIAERRDERGLFAGPPMPSESEQLTKNARS